MEKRDPYFANVDPGFDDAESMLHYCEEFVSSPALQSLNEAVQGCDMKQLHEMAKVIREASKEIGNTLRAEDLAVAVENWKETGSITKAIKAVVDWIEWRPVGGHVSEIFYR